MIKTIVVHIDDSPSQHSRLHAAAVLAAEWDARLVASAATGLAPRDYNYMDGALTGPLPLVRYDELREAARQRLERGLAQARRLGAGQIEARLTEDSPENALILQARYADLVITSQLPATGERARLVTMLPEYVALNSPRPVLVVPDTYDGQPVGGKVIVGWDGSMEATRAVTAALPILQRASGVQLALFNPDTAGGLHGEQPGADMALYLARHGIRVEVFRQRTEAPIGRALLGLARDTEAGLIVAGCYGHSRYREWLLGGVTYSLLSHARIPVLFAH